MIVVKRERAAVINTPHGSEIRPSSTVLLPRSSGAASPKKILPPGAAVGRHHHLETEEIYYVLSGEGRMTVGAETRDVASLAMPS